MVKAPGHKSFGDLRKFARNRGTGDDMAPVGVVRRMTSSDGDPHLDQFGMSDVAVEIATIDLCAEMPGHDRQWTDPPTADPHHVERETVECRERVRRRDEHVISQWHLTILPYHS
jgi:hypothetical protein